MQTSKAKRRFFSTVTSYFKTKYAGRYFSVILKELASIEPKAFLQILIAAKLRLPESHKDALLAGELQVNLEWHFPSKGRVADLALYLDPHLPSLLIEVKAEDVMRRRQLDDYLSVVKANSKAKNVEHRTSFLLLSRYPLAPDEEKKLQKAHRLPVAQLRHGQLHDILRNSSGPVSRMLREYLEDLGMTYQTLKLKQERKGLLHMARRMSGANISGYGRTKSLSGIDSVLSTMEKLFGNIEVLASPLYAKNRKMFGNRFRRDFEVQRWCKIPKGIQRKAFASGAAPVMTNDEISELICENLRPSGGDVYLYGFGRFVNPKYAGLSIGYYVELDGNEASTGMFAEFEWSGSNDVDWYERASQKPFTRFPNETDAHKMLAGLLADAKRKVRKTTKMFEPLLIP